VIGVVTGEGEGLKALQNEMNELKSEKDTAGRSYPATARGTYTEPQGRIGWF
jgi:hypothetical protein